MFYSDVRCHLRFCLKNQKRIFGTFNYFYRNISHKEMYVLCSAKTLFELKYTIK